METKKNPFSSPSKFHPYPQRETGASPPGRQLPDTMASVDKIAYLSRADFEGVARILHQVVVADARIEADLKAELADLYAARAGGSGDAELTAELEAKLAEIYAARRKYKFLIGRLRRPHDKVGEMAPMSGGASPDPAHQEEPRVEEAKEAEVKGIDIIDLSRDEEEEERAPGGCEEKDEDEEDTESLSQRAKRLRRLMPGELESGKEADAAVQKDGQDVVTREQPPAKAASGAGGEVTPN